ncbi:hypothetical protein DFJ66_4147 [Saccharothrix variisporea]|uniref:Uncharacterized protein n=1 Tax=Saccharothrix variisporea TaxID=543527 RepID=A0A495X8T5_9PSEU|nr:hypothetical protein DFJ66_4147 [Saccharothrix variisporea]
MSGRPWPDFRPGPLGAFGAWWRRRQERRGEDFTFVPPSSSHQHVFETPLPSAVYGLDFQAKLTVHWRLDLTTGARHNSPRSAAINDIVQRAKKITERAMLVHHAPLQFQLGDELAAERQVEGTHVWARAEGVELTVDDGDLESARKHIELLRTTTVRQAERDAERAEIRYLRDEVLTDLSTATIWWLHRNGYQVEQAVALSQHLNELVRIAAQRRDQHWADTLVTSFETALPRLSDGHRHELKQHLAKALGIYGGTTVAEEFAEQVGLPHNHISEHVELPSTNNRNRNNVPGNHNGAKPLP